MVTTDLLTSLDSAVHHSHYYSGMAAAHMLHQAIKDLHCCYGGKTEHTIASNLPKYLSSLVQFFAQPRVMWTLGETIVQHSSGGPATDVLLLPTNTQLDSSAKVVERAKQVFHPKIFEELKSHGTASLGSAISIDRASMQVSRVVHLVCRTPGDPALKQLDQCFQHLGGSESLVRYVLPLWGQPSELDLWATVLAKWTLDVTRSLDGTYRHILIRFRPEDQSLALELERKLIRLGVLVGRESNMKCSHPETGTEYDVRQMAKNVTIDGPFTPDIYANWLYSGVKMPYAAWLLHERVIQERA